MFFIQDVFAENLNGVSTSAVNSSNIIGNLIPLFIIIAIFYFLLIRPQQKKQKEHEKEIDSLKPNDMVLTAGGIYAKVLKIGEKSLSLSISDGVNIEVVPNTVTLIKEEKNKNEATEKKAKISKNTKQNKK